MTENVYLPIRHIDIFSHGANGGFINTLLQARMPSAACVRRRSLGLAATDNRPHIMGVGTGRAQIVIVGCGFGGLLLSSWIYGYVFFRRGSRLIIRVGPAELF